MTIIKPDQYATLVREIAELYTQARQALVESYWQIGRRIVEHEQQGEASALYGKQLIEKLSEDLTSQVGHGFSERNLYKMRQFYLGHKISPAPAELNWTQHVELLPVTDEVAKRRLERRIISHKLSPRQIREEVRLLKESEQASVKDQGSVFLPEPCRDKPLQCYGVIDPVRVTCTRGRVMVDCGFNIWREMPAREAASCACPQGGDPSYTYPARVESVIDGDTLWVIVDCGRAIFTRQKVRLHLIDSPEKGTPDGDRATRFIKRVLKKSPDIVIRTHHYDKYARYLADVFYLPDETNPKTVYATGCYLNQQLIDKGLAQAWKA
jgi:hypothetical protein